MNYWVVLLLLFFFTASSVQNEIIPPPPLVPPYWNWITNIKRALFPPPNLDFRGGSNDGEAGAGDKVKEAVTKTLDKGKATLQQSAKSAANLAKDAFAPPQDL